MRIAIDLTATPKSKTGIGRYMLGLLKGLQEEDKENEYFLFVQNDDLDGFGVYAPNFHMVPVNSKIMRKQYLRIVWEQIVFPWRIRKINADILHCPNYTMPYFLKLISAKTKVVGVFHDMSYFIYPEYLVSWKCKMFQWYIKHTAKKADKLLTISNSSKVDIPRFCKPKNPDIEVTYMGVNESFFNSVPANDDLLKKFGINDKYIIYVGTLEPRKNVPNLIRGFKEAYSELCKLSGSGFKLIIVGKKGWDYDEIFKTVSSDDVLKENVIFTGFVEDNEMKSLMRSSDTVAYISRYEGFGIPVIEGMASSVPTVTTNVSSLKEVASDCCFLCSPDDINSIKDALISSVDSSFKLKESDETAVNKRDKALKRAEFFSWENCAKATLKAYKSIYSNQ